MASKIQLRRDTASNWSSINPILSQGEPGYEIDTRKIKYGNGTSHWNSLPYHTGTGNLTFDEYTMSGDSDITIRSGSTEFWKIDIKYDDSSPELPSSVCYDNNGNLISLIILDSYSSDLVKHSSEGDLIWRVKIQNCEILPSFAIDSDNNIFILATIDGPPGGNPSTKIIKISGSDGSIIVQQNYFSVYSEGISISVNSDNNVIITGGTLDTPNSDADLLYILINGNDLNIIWSKSIGKPGLDYLTYNAIDTDDNIISIGQSDRINSPLLNEIIVTKHNKNGILIWAKSIQIPNSYNATGFSIDTDSLGNIFFSGNFELKNIGSPTSFETALLVSKMDSSGNIEWSRRVLGACGNAGTGLKTDSTGNSYIVSQAFAENFPGMVIAKLDSSGNILWQKSLTDGGENLTSTNNFYGLSRRISIYEDKLAVSGIYFYNESNLSENDFRRIFVVQIPSDGREIKLGIYRLIENKIPSGITNLSTTNFDFNSWEEFNIELDTFSDDAEITNSSVSCSTVRTSPNDIIISNNGNVNISKNSNIKLDKEQIGFISFYGNIFNDYSPIYYKSSVCDSEGNVYSIGDDLDNDNPIFISKVDPNGNMMWVTNIRSGSGARFTIDIVGSNYEVTNINNSGSNYVIGDKIVISGEDLGGFRPDNNLVLNVTGVSNGNITSVEIFSGVPPIFPSQSPPFLSVQDYYDSVQGDSVGIAIDPVTKNLVAVASLYTVEGDPFSFNYGWNKMSIFTIDPLIGTVISTRELTRQGDIYPYAVKVTSEGKPVVVGWINNEYEEYGQINPLTGSTNTGSIIINKNDIIPNSPFIYPGDGIMGNWFIYGTGINDQSEVVGVNYYPNITGTASLSGQDSEFSIIVDPISGVYSVDNIDNGGSGYAIGEKIIIPGTSLGGYSPQNDLTLNVDNINPGLSNTITNVSIDSGMGSTEKLRLDIDQSINFTQPGNWYIRKSIDTEAFIWTPDWEKSIGGPGGYDRFYSVAIDSSNNIYAVGEKTIGNEIGTKALVVKFNSSGDILWSKNINTLSPTMYVEKAVDICIDGTGKIIVSSVDDFHAVLTKLDASGNILWQTHTSIDTGHDPSVAVDSDNNIIMAVQHYDEDYGGRDRIFILKFDSNGINIWSRKIVGNYEEHLGNSRSLNVLGKSYILTGTTYSPAFFYNNAFCAKFPLDGNGLGKQEGYWSYLATDQIDFTHPVLNSDNTQIDYRNTSMIQTNPQEYFSGSSSEWNYYSYPVKTRYGGSIEFADGSTQDRSTLDVPQNYISYDYTITSEDRGKHIYIDNSGTTIYVPDGDQQENLPIGSVVSIVNISGGNIYIYPADGGSANIYCAGAPSQNNAWYLENYGMATLLKIQYNYWMLSGATIGDDS